MSGWHVPKLWETSAYILGGGPSLGGVDIDRLKNSNVIAVNNAYQLADWLPFVYFMDEPWFRWHEEELRGFQGLKVTGAPNLKGEPGLKWLQRGKRHVYDPRPGYISRGNNSGQGAICLAVALGAKKVILLGFDMHAKMGHNYHQDHPRGVPKSIYADKYFQCFNMLKPSLEALGVQVVNATLGSALPTFPIVDPEEVLPC